MKPLKWNHVLAVVGYSYQFKREDHVQEWNSILFIKEVNDWVQCSFKFGLVSLSYGTLFSFYHILSLQVQYKYETMEFNLVSPYQLNITEGLKIIEEKNLYIDISEC